MTEPQPSERSGESGYGNDSGFAESATAPGAAAGQDVSGERDASGGPDTPTTEELADPGEPPD